MYWQKEQRDHEKRERMFTIFGSQFSRAVSAKPRGDGQNGQDFDDLGG